MSSHDPRPALRRWYDRPLPEDLDLCGEGPTFGRLVEWIARGAALSAAEVAHVESCAKCRRTVEAIRRAIAEAGALDGDAPANGDAIGLDPDPPVRSRRGRRWVVQLPAARGRRGRRISLSFGGLAAAAALGIGAVLFFMKTGREQAAAFDLREVGYARPILVTGPSIDAEFPDLLAETQALVEERRREVQERLASDEDREGAWYPWTQLYRNLRWLGRWEEAFAEMNGLLAFATELENTPKRYTPYGIVLGDLSITYAAIGDYDQALAFRRRAYDYARDYQEWNYRTGATSDKRPHGLLASLAASMFPQCRHLSLLHAARGEMAEAWRYDREAEDWLLRFFREECRVQGYEVRPDASLTELCLTIVGRPHEGLESQVVQVREMYLNRARLHRLDRNLDAAEVALDLGSTNPDYPHADESRLDFNEPMERLRIAIARGDFAAALRHADEAAQQKGPRSFPTNPRHPPISVIARAELMFLRGVALAGSNPADPEAEQFIEVAIDLLATQGGAGETRAAERSRALTQEWTDVLNRIRAVPLPST